MIKWLFFLLLISPVFSFGQGHETDTLTALEQLGGDGYAHSKYLLISFTIGAQKKN